MEGNIEEIVEIQENMDSKNKGEECPNSPVMVKIPVPYWKILYVQFEVPSDHQAVVMCDNGFYIDPKSIKDTLNTGVGSEHMSQFQRKGARIIGSTKSARSLTFKRDIYIVHTGSRKINPLAQEGSSRNGIDINFDSIGEYQVVFPALFTTAYAGMKLSPEEIVMNLESRLKSIMRIVALDFVNSQNYPFRIQQDLTRYLSYDQKGNLDSLGIKLKIAMENVRKS